MKLEPGFLSNRTFAGRIEYLTSRIDMKILFSTGTLQKEKWAAMKQKGSAWSNPARYDVLLQSECFKNSDTTLVLNSISSFIHMVHFPIATFTM